MNKITFFDLYNLNIKYYQTATYFDVNGVKCMVYYLDNELTDTQKKQLKQFDNLFMFCKARSEYAPEQTKPVMIIYPFKPSEYTFYANYYKYKNLLKANRTNTKYFTIQFYKTFIKEQEKSEWTRTKQTNFYIKNGGCYCYFLELFYKYNKI